MFIYLFFYSLCTCFFCIDFMDCLCIALYVQYSRRNKFYFRHQSYDSWIDFWIVSNWLSNWLSNKLTLKLTLESTHESTLGSTLESTLGILVYTWDWRNNYKDCAETFCSHLRAPWFIILNVLRDLRLETVWVNRSIIILLEKGNIGLHGAIYNRVLRLCPQKGQYIFQTKQQSRLFPLAKSDHLEL